MSISEKIHAYLEEIFQLDWEHFNELSLLEQMQECKKTTKGFEKIIQENQYTNVSELYDILDSFKVQFEKPEIKGKIKVFFQMTMLNGKGGIAFLNKFKSLIHKNEFRKAKEASKLACDCELSLEFKEHPDTDNFNKIGWINDGYYFPKVYICRECDRYWNTYSGGDLGLTIWEKHSSEDDKSLVFEAEED